MVELKFLKKKNKKQNKKKKKTTTTKNKQHINVELKSINGNVSIKLTAYTANRYAGSMAVVDWDRYKNQWPHRENIDLPRSVTRPIVAVLISLDCADLHYALQEVRCRQFEQSLD